MSGDTDARQPGSGMTDNCERMYHRDLVDAGEFDGYLIEEVRDGARELTQAIREALNGDVDRLSTWWERAVERAAERATDEKEGPEEGCWYTGAELGAVDEDGVPYVQDDGTLEPWAEYVATDADGEVWQYQAKPVIKENSQLWDVPPGGLAFGTTAGTCYALTDRDWRKTLRRVRKNHES